MIPLTLQLNSSDPMTPTVLRLRTDPKTDGKPLTRDDAILLRKVEKVAVFGSVDGAFAVATHDQELDLDVVLIDPRQRKVRRLIRSQSNHNTFLLTERCDQLCVMCSQPPKPHHHDLFDVFYKAAGLAPENCVLGLTGGEPTLYKAELFSLIKSVRERRPDITFHVLTNGQHFCLGDLPDLIESRAYGTQWAIPLYSTRPDRHDQIVGKPRAHRELMKALGVLARSGALIEIRTVVLRSNVDELPQIAKFVAKHVPSVCLWAIMQLENIGYARQNWASLFFDNSVEFESVGVALDVAAA